jgi:hypothetical protein
MSIYSEYENINLILSYRTSNLGLVTLDPTILPPSDDIFSYIDNNGIKIIDVSTLNNTLSENHLMGGLIFNTNITNSAKNLNSDSKISDAIPANKKNEIANSIKYILDTTKNYNIGDFSFNIKYNTMYYNNNFEYFDISNRHAVPDDITDLDTSYYASQNVIKYLFLLDTLSEIYRVVNENKVTKSDILNIFNFFEIKCRYVVDANGNWKLYNPSSAGPKYYTMTFANTINSPTPVLTITNASIPEYKAGANSMIQFFNEILLKHFRYVKKADMIYADNFRNFYKLCRIMLNYNILYSLRFLIAFNAHAIRDNAISALTYNNDCSGDIRFETAMPLAAPLLHENYYNHIMPSCVNANYDCDFSIDVIENGEYAYIKPISALISQENINSLVSYKNISQKIIEAGNSEVVYRIISTNKNKDAAKPYRSKPVSKVFTYTSGTKSEITFVYNTNNTVKTIEGLIPYMNYYIKLHNFSTIGCQSFSSANYHYTWNNDTKILEITNKNELSSLNLEELHKLYLIEISPNTKQIIYPSEFTASTISVLLTKIIASDKTKLASTPFSISSNNLVTITYHNNNTSPVLQEETLVSSHFYTNQAKISSLKYYILPDTDVFGLIYISKSAFNIPMNIRFNGPNNNPIISPSSFETYDYQIAKTSPTDFLQHFYLPSLTNLKILVSDSFKNDTKDNDTIIKTMSNLSNVNEKISKNSGVVKTNYNNFKKEQTKVVSSNTVDIIAIILFVITLFIALFIPNSSFTKNTSLLVSGGLFLIVLLVFGIIYGIIYTRYTELFNIFDETEGVLSYKTEVNAIIAAILRNMYTERTIISQKVILPSLIKENKYFEEKSQRMNIYKTSSNGDLQIERITRKRNVARITYLLNITLIISTALLLYVIAPQYWKIILGISILLIVICLFIYYHQIVTIVHTNSANQYWAKPKVSLANLDTVNVSTS